MQIVITGATGFVGCNFLEWVLKHEPNHQLTCLVRDREKAKGQWTDKLAESVQWIQTDLRALSTPAIQALQAADWVFHIAALVSLRDGPEFYEMNTAPTQNLVKVLQDSTQLKRLVLVSSISAVDRPPGMPATGPLTEASVPHPNTDYGKSKRQAEEAVIHSGLPYSILRPSYIYGPYPRLKSSMDRLIYDVLSQQHYTRFSFPGRASEIYAEDLAEMIWLAAHHPNTENQIFFVSNPEPVTIGSVYPQLAQVLKVPHQSMGVLPQDIPRFQRSLYRQFPSNLMLRIMFEDYFYCASDQWHQATGYQAKYGYQEGMAKTVAWYRGNGLI